MTSTTSMTSSLPDKFALIKIVKVLRIYKQLSRAASKTAKKMIGNNITG